MKMITINVDESVYTRFQDEAAKRNQSASELIREAMVLYDEQAIRRATSIFDDKPALVGRVIAPLSIDDDILGEMLS